MYRMQDAAGTPDRISASQVSADDVMASLDEAAAALDAAPATTLASQVSSTTTPTTGTKPAATVVDVPAAQPDSSVSSPAPRSAASSPASAARSASSATSPRTAPVESPTAVGGAKRSRSAAPASRSSAPPSAAPPGAKQRRRTGKTPGRAELGTVAPDSASLEDLQSAQAAWDGHDATVHGVAAGQDQEPQVRAWVPTLALQRMLKLCMNMNDSNVMTLHCEPGQHTQPSRMVVTNRSKCGTAYYCVMVNCLARSRMPAGEGQCMLAPSFKELSSLLSLCPADVNHETSMYTLPNQDHLNVTLRDEGSTRSYSSQFMLLDHVPDEMGMPATPYDVYMTVDPSPLTAFLSRMKCPEVTVGLYCTADSPTAPHARTVLAFILESSMSQSPTCLTLDMKPGADEEGCVDEAVLGDVTVPRLHLACVSSDEAATQVYTRDMLQHMTQLYQQSFVCGILQTACASAGTRLQLLLPMQAAAQPAALCFGDAQSMQATVRISPIPPTADD